MGKASGWYFRHEMSDLFASFKKVIRTREDICTYVNGTQISDGSTEITDINIITVRSLLVCGEHHLFGLYLNSSGSTQEDTPLEILKKFLLLKYSRSYPS